MPYYFLLLVQVFLISFLKSEKWLIAVSHLNLECIHYTVKSVALEFPETEQRKPLNYV